MFTEFIVNFHNYYVLVRFEHWDFLLLFTIISENLDVNCLFTSDEYFLVSTN
jgi:hypothetical protein